MTEEQKPNEQEIEKPAQTPEGEVTPEPDYKALLEEEKKRRIKAESIIQRNKERPQETPDEFAMPDEDLISKQVAERVKEEVSQVEQRLIQNQLLAMVKSVASNPDEEALIRYHLENTIRLSGDLNADVQKAKLLANGNRLSSQLNEMKRMVDSKNSISKGGGSGGQKPQPETEPKITEAERKLRRGLGLSETPSK